MENKTTSKNPKKLFLKIYVPLFIVCIGVIAWQVNTPMGRIFYGAIWPIFLVSVIAIGFSYLAFTKKWVGLKGCIAGYGIALIGTAIWFKDSFDSLPNDVREWYWHIQKIGFTVAFSTLIIGCIVLFLISKFRKPVSGSQA